MPAKVTFETMLQKAEKIVDQLESGGLSLEDTVKRYEEGISLLDALEKQLKDATQRLTMIRETKNGLAESPMEAEE